MALLLLIACRSGSSSRPETTVQVGKFFSDVECPIDSPQCLDDKKAILELLDRFYTALKTKEVVAVSKLIDQKSGVYVDLKAKRSYAEFVAELQNPDGYFVLFFLETKRLRKFTNDKKQVAVRDILRKARSIEVEFHFNKKEDLCEVKLKPNGKFNFRLNNPVFIFRNTRWYFYRLM